MKQIIALSFITALLFTSCGNDKESQEKEQSNDEKQKVVQVVGVEADSSFEETTPQENTVKVVLPGINVCGCSTQIADYMDRIAAGEEVGKAFEELQANCQNLIDNIGQDAFDAMQLECQDYINLKEKIDITGLTTCDCKAGIEALFEYTGEPADMPEEMLAIQDKCMILKHDMGYSAYMEEITACE